MHVDELLKLRILFSRMAGSGRVGSGRVCRALSHGVGLNIDISKPHRYFAFDPFMIQYFPLAITTFTSLYAWYLLFAIEYRSLVRYMLFGIWCHSVLISLLTINYQVQRKLIYCNMQRNSKLIRKDKGFDTWSVESNTSVRNLGNFQSVGFFLLLLLVLRFEIDVRSNTFFKRQPIILITQNR